ncbi:hypothetical protein [Streptomyces sp. NBC_01483]|uniref:hypothetical protein n=1 Tax=Streptomyces sp. NBC_01483 TaxID=2903883 RepID=UPI002E3495B8|nr:hypothetical protein [Streptomyces sp. NBC_01483]
MHSEELAECAPQFRRQGSRIRANVDGTAPSVTPTRSLVLIGSAKSSSAQDGMMINDALFDTSGQLMHLSRVSVSDLRASVEGPTVCDLPGWF